MAIFSSADARRAVERGFDDSVRFLADLVSVPSLLGDEEPAQELVETRLDELLRRLLLAEQARHADQIGQEPDRVVETALDRAACVRR